MKEYKFLEVSDAYFPVVDGAINVVYNYTKELNKLTPTSLATIKASKSSKYKDKEDFKIFRCTSLYGVENYRLGLPEIDFNFKNQLESEHFDIIHTHSPFTMGQYAIHLGKKYNIPVVATLHTQYHKDFERALHGFTPVVKTLLKEIVKVYKHADSVWTVSEASKKYLRIYGYKGNIEVIRNGTDYVYPDNSLELIEKINKKYNLYNQENVFIFVGRMAFYKNLKFLCESLKKVKDKNIDFKMLFVGGGFDLEELKKYAESLNLLNNIIFTDNIKDRALLQGYYLRADLLLFPSTFDMASIAQCEAAAHKLPSLVIKNSCSAEGVIDGYNGFISRESRTEYANKIISICSQKEKLKEIGENAYKTLYRTWDMVAKEVYNKYIEVIENYKKKK